MGEHTSMNAQDVLNQTREAQLRLVRFLYCDNGGVIRGKATHASKLPTRIHEGIGHVHAMSAWTGVETLASVEGMGPVGEFRLVPDPETFAILPYVPNTGSMMCDQIDADGQPWGADPRGFLRRMVARLAEKGMRMEATAEHEFYFAREEMGSTFPPITASAIAVRDWMSRPRLWMRSWPRWKPRASLSNYSTPKRDPHSKNSRLPTARPCAPPIISAVCARRFAGLQANLAFLLPSRPSPSSIPLAAALISTSVYGEPTRASARGKTCSM